MPRFPSLTPALNPKLALVSVCGSDYQQEKKLPASFLLFPCLQKWEVQVRSMYKVLQCATVQGNQKPRKNENCIVLQIQEYKASNRYKMVAKQ